ncbi:MAG: cupredoxin domain-containing protein, partial [Proteobacteria bacterium]|nr:cupredoxin domain-containing protein [Pseudomonadota bacterium]
PIEILVQDGVYTPSRIQVATGKPVTLVFMRKDPAPCAETVLFDGFNISKHLPMDTPVEIKITPEKTGEYAFTCQMKMYQGSLVVV